MKNNRHGFSLMEVMVGVGLLALVSLGFLQFQRRTAQMVRVVSDNAALAAALTSIERDIANDVPYLPPQENDENVKASTIFNDAQKTGTRCYDKTGSRASTCDDWATQPIVYFRTKFYKAAVVDQSLDPASPHARIPLSRVRFQVEYKVNNKVQEPMYFTRLFANAMQY